MTQAGSPHISDSKRMVPDEHTRATLPTKHLLEIPACHGAEPSHDNLKRAGMPVQAVHVSAKIASLELNMTEGMDAHLKTSRRALQ